MWNKPLPNPFLFSEVSVFHQILCVEDLVPSPFLVSDSESSDGEGHGVERGRPQPGGGPPIATNSLTDN